MVGGLVKHLRRETRANPLLVHGMLLDCAVQLPTKAPVYALLVGAQNQGEAALNMQIQRPSKQTAAAHRPCTDCASPLLAACCGGARCCAHIPSDATMPPPPRRRVAECG